MRISLEFVSEQTPTHRARLEYAFRLFCAIYGHEPRVGAEPPADATISYVAESSSPTTVRLTNGYSLRATRQPPPPPHSYARQGQSTVLFYPVLPQLQPDWLGEIFEWISCADEYSVADRDAVGRVPFAASYVGRHHLDPLLPYASVAMHLLQDAITRVCPGSPSVPLCPVPFARHLVVNTHDVDFLPDGRFSSVCRLAKNSVVSFLANKTTGAALEQAKTAIAVALGGRDPLDQVAALVDREDSRAVSASFYFLCENHHRRDGNYRIDEASTLALMRALELKMEIGVHGTYCSLDEPDRLAREFETLRRLGFRPLGGRLHWLRFTVPQLIQAIERAGAAYDSSLGWPHTPGFRAAACFAFPPYDLEREQVAPFLEIPLAIMDQATVHSHNGGALRGARELLAASRSHSWGGISVLWHPTAFGGGQFPGHVGDTFWKLQADSLEQGDTWISAASFVKQVWQRYRDAGLLPHRHFA